MGRKSVLTIFICLSIFISFALFANPCKDFFANSFRKIKSLRTKRSDLQYSDLIKDLSSIVELNASKRQFSLGPSFLLQVPIQEMLFNTIEGKNILALTKSNTIEDLLIFLENPSEKEKPLAKAIKNRLFLLKEFDYNMGISFRNETYFTSNTLNALRQDFLAIKDFDELEKKLLYKPNISEEEILKHFLNREEISANLIENLSKKEEALGKKTGLFKNMSSCIKRNPHIMLQSTIVVLIKDRLIGHSSNFKANLDNYGWEGLFGKEAPELGIGKDFATLASDQLMGGIGGIGNYFVLYKFNKKFNKINLNKDIWARVPGMILWAMAWDFFMKMGDSVVWYNTNKLVQEKQLGRKLNVQEKHELKKAVTNRYIANTSFGQVNAASQAFIHAFTLGSMCVMSEKFTPGTGKLSKKAASIVLMGDTTAKYLYTYITQDLNIKWRDNFVFKNWNPGEMLWE